MSSALCHQISSWAEVIVTFGSYHWGSEHSDHVTNLLLKWRNSIFAWSVQR